eukprot:3181168-Prymnesium_polylepis.1
MDSSETHGTARGSPAGLAHGACPWGSSTGLAPAVEATACPLSPRPPSPRLCSPHAPLARLRRSGSAARRRTHPARCTHASGIAPPTGGW